MMVAMHSRFFIVSAVILAEVKITRRLEASKKSKGAGWSGKIMGSIVSVSNCNLSGLQKMAYIHNNNRMYLNRPFQMYPDVSEIFGDICSHSPYQLLYPKCFGKLGW